MSGVSDPEGTERPPGSLRLSPSGAEHTAADWEKAAAAVLRKAGRMSGEDPDADVRGRLTLRTLDGIPVSALDTAADVTDVAAGGRPGRAPYTRGTRTTPTETGWDIRPVFDGPDATATAEAVLVDLQNGATSIWLTLGEGGLGPDDLPAVLSEVLLDLAPVVLEAGTDPVAAAQALVRLLGERGVRAADGTNLGADPIGSAVRRGVRVDEDAERVLADVTALARDSGTLAVVVDATAVHDLGGSDAQELGYSLAVGAAYLRMLAGAGVPLDEALGLMEFRYAATDEQFPTIAKLRAARRLWSRVAELSGAGEAVPGQRQHAVTSRPMMAKYDPWVNMLRTTVAAFAAGVGGAAAVTVLPFDAALGVPDRLGRRIARNTSSLLVSEAHVARVTDPGGGSYAVERLTADLAGAGWEELGRIEAAGGIVAALADGSLRERVDAVAARRDAAIARRERPLTGVSEFPHLGEPLPQRTPHPEGSPRVRRYGAPFEAMRDEPAGDPVFLATLGTVAAHTARATFATNLFAAGGVGVVGAGPSETVDDVLRAWSGPDGGQPVVCLAGADAAYAAWGSDLVAALRAAGARWVILAGLPEILGPPDGSPVDDSCAAGVDALDFLRRTREQLEAHR